MANTKIANTKKTAKLKSNFNKAVGRRIKKKRIGLELTREKLACMVKVSDRFIYDVEVGKKGMSAWTLYKLSKALGVSVEWLLYGAGS